MKTFNLGRRAGVCAVGSALLVTHLLSGGGVAAAQDGEVSCGLAPLELPLFSGTPVAVFGTPSPVSSPEDVAVGDSEIREALEQYVACTNTGDPLLVWAIFTPRWYAERFADPEEHYLPAFEQMLDQPATPPEEPLDLVSVDEITPLDDGRVDVVATFRSGDQTWTDGLTLAQVDGVWLIDDVQLINPDGS